MPLAKRKELSKFYQLSTNIQHTVGLPAACKRLSQSHCTYFSEKFWNDWTFLNIFSAITSPAQYSDTNCLIYDPAFMQCAIKT